MKGHTMNETDEFVAILFIFGIVLTSNEELNFLNIIGVACMVAALYIYQKDTWK